MGGELPDYYFRVKENGALVFRVDTENRQRRIELQPIASVNVQTGTIRPQGGRELTPEELRRIEDWRAARQERLAARDLDDIHRAIDHLNLTAHWAQSRADDAALEEVTDALLLAMHDLRSVLVRKKTERLSRGDPAGI